MTSLSIIIPAYNEEMSINKTILSTLALKLDFPKIDFDIIVIDDGSKDDTYNVVKKTIKSSEIRLYKNDFNQGLGNTIKKGIKLANGEKFIFIPGDNDIPETLLKKLLKNIDSAEIVTSFFINDEIRGRFRNFISGIFLLIYSTTFGIFLKYINGPAIYPTAKLKELTLHSRKFSIIAEINTKLLTQGLSFMEIPGYRQNNDEKSPAVSTGSLLETIITYIKLIYIVKIKHKELFNKVPKRIYFND